MIISWKPAFPLFTIIAYLSLTIITSHVWQNHPDLTYIFPQLYFFFVVIFFKLYYKISFRDIGLSSHRLFKHIFIGLSLGCLLCAFLAGASFIAEYYFSSMGHEYSLDFSPIYLMSLMLIAPIVEEVFFRGIFLASLLKQYTIFISILLSSMVFMGVHGQWHLGALLLGIVTSLLYIKTQSIISGIVVHMISNTSIIFIYYYWNNLLPILKYFYR